MSWRRLSMRQVHHELELLSLVRAARAGLIDEDPSQVQLVVSGVLLDSTALPGHGQAPVGLRVTRYADVGPDGGPSGDHRHLSPLQSYCFYLGKGDGGSQDRSIRPTAFDPSPEMYYVVFEQARAFVAD